VDVVEALRRLGGVGTRAEVIAASDRRSFEQALRDGLVERVARGRYALPTASAARRSAVQLSGTAVLLSAAAHWGWTMKWQPRQPQVAVGRGRRLTPEQRASAQVSWVDLPASDVEQRVTTAVRTVIDCAARLPFDEALAIADSALRNHSVTRAELTRAVRALPARGPRRRVTRVVELADSRAANPFESVLRAIALEVPGLSVVPQVRIDRNGRWVGRVDLADVGLKIVLEADSFEFHGEGELFEKDCVRYDELVADGWLVLRFPWTRVMTKPGWVAEMITDAVAIRLAEQALREELRLTHQQLAA
jgi:very-short-patch-repair endonuclease